LKAKRIKLVSGDLLLEVSIPSKNLVGVLTPKAVQPKGESEKLIREALENPVDMKSPENILDGGSKLPKISKLKWKYLWIIADFRLK